MLKGRGNSGADLLQKSSTPSTSMVGTSSDTMLLEPIEKAKKKLSFREPEIMGYYMQMKQGIGHRLSRRIKSVRNGVGAGNKTTATTLSSGSPTAKSCIFRNCASEDNEVNNSFGGSTEDLNLEVGILRILFRKLGRKKKYSVIISRRRQCVRLEFREREINNVGHVFRMRIRSRSYERR